MNEAELSSSIHQTPAVIVWAVAEGREAARCGGNRPVDLQGRTYTTNDVSGCPKGGLLTGTEKVDKLDGEDGDDEIHGLGAKDWVFGGLGSDVIYGEDSDDSLEGGAYGPYPDESSKDVLYGGPGKDHITDQDGGEDVFYGGDGNDYMYDEGGGEDVLYGGDGDDVIDAFGFPRADRQRDKLYCGEGEDHYVAHKLDYVDSSCEVKDPPANL